MVGLQGDPLRPAMRDDEPCNLDGDLQDSDEDLLLTIQGNLEDLACRFGHIQDDFEICKEKSVTFEATCDKFRLLAGGSHLLSLRSFSWELHHFSWILLAPCFPLFSKTYKTV
jgi:hypothetical protein